jgi:hypothetical protein
MQVLAPLVLPPSKLYLVGSGGANSGAGGGASPLPSPLGRRWKKKRGRGAGVRRRRREPPRLWLKRPQIFNEENPSPCTFAIVPGSVAIVYRSHYRRQITTVHRITQILVHNLLHVHNGVQHYKPQG